MKKIMVELMIWLLEIFCIKILTGDFGVDVENITKAT